MSTAQSFAASTARGSLMQNMPPALIEAIRLSEESRARMEAHRNSRVDDRRVAQAAIEHEDRRKGPRRMSEKRAMLLFNIEID